MKPFLAFLTVTLVTGLAGCRSFGYNHESAKNNLTPDISQKEYVRTYDQTGQPAVTMGTPPSQTDPASPDYRAPH